MRTKAKKKTLNFERKTFSILARATNRSLALCLKLTKKVSFGETFLMIVKPIVYSIVLSSIFLFIQETICRCSA